MRTAEFEAELERIRNEIANIWRVPANILFGCGETQASGTAAQQAFTKRVRLWQQEVLQGLQERAEEEQPEVAAMMKQAGWPRG